MSGNGRDDDGRPSMSEALEALRGGQVPDLSGPASFGRTFEAFASGADPGELMAALKASGLPSVPLSELGRAAGASARLRWCKSCQRSEPVNASCPAAAEDGDPVRDTYRPAGEAGTMARAGSPPAEVLPADPFTPGQQAGIAAMDIYDDLLGAGMPLASVERVIAHMLADLAEKAEPG